MFKCIKENILNCVKIIKFLINDYRQHKEQEERLKLEQREVEKENKRIKAEERKLFWEMRKQMW